LEADRVVSHFADLPTVLFELVAAPAGEFAGNG